MSDEPVSPEATLVRGIPPARLPIRGSGRTMPSSDSWNPSSDDAGTSCFVLSDDVTAADVCGFGGWPALIGIRVADLEAIRQPGVDEVLWAMHDDLGDGTPCGAAHALVLGWPPGRASRKKMLKAVLNASHWVVGPVFRDP